MMYSKRSAMLYRNEVEDSMISGDWVKNKIDMGRLKVLVSRNHITGKATKLKFSVQNSLVCPY